MISQYFQAFGAAQITLGDFFINILIAFLCGIIHVTVYRIAYRGAGYSLSLLNALVMLAVITALTIMVIGDSLARAFGLVGAMSIIRFRTAIKDVMDVVHIFLALAIGMTAGVGLRFAAIIGTISIGIIYLLLIQFNQFSTVRGQYIIQIVFAPDANNDKEPFYQRFIQKYCADYRILNVKSQGSSDLLEVSFYIKPKSENSITGLTNDIKSQNLVKSVFVFTDEEQF